MESWFIPQYTSVSLVYLVLLHIYCYTGTPRGPSTFAASIPFSPSTTSKFTVSLSPIQEGIILPRVILLYGSLLCKYIFLSVIPVVETITISYTEPF